MSFKNLTQLTEDTTHIKHTHHKPPKMLPKITHKLIAIISVILITMGDRERINAINSVLDLNGTFPYLTNNLTGEVIEPRDYMDFENIYAPNETYKLKQTAQGKNYHVIKAFDFANYFQSDYWHYSNEEDLRLSAQPVANPDKCTKHLDWLEKYLNRSEEILFNPGEQHVNLMTVVDAFGHPETATYYGHGYWLGSHYECMRASVDRAKFEQEECLLGNASKLAECQQHSLNQSTPEDTMKFRYCIGKAHDKDWPSVEQDRYQPRISYKVGLCLPETCETLSFKRHQSRIEHLMRLNFPEYMKKRIILHELYCLPDNRSPIRELPISSRIFLGICLAWLVTLIAATAIYSCYKRHQEDLRNILKASELVHLNQQVNDLTIHLDDKQSLNGCGLLTSNGARCSQQASPNGHFDVDCVMCKPQDTECLNGQQTDCKSVVSSNSKLLLGQPTKAIDVTNQLLPSIDNDNNNFNNNNNIQMHINIDLERQRQANLSSRTSSSSSLSTWLNDSPAVIKILQALSIKETLKEFQKPPELLRQPDAVKKLRINLNALDSIKCLCCILVIFGHIIFIHMQHLSNITHTIELSHQIYPRFLIAFFNFVDTFFIISGMLTAYFIFKRFNKNTFSNPIIWIYISLLRLLRLSPVYILVFWYIKTLSVYISDGPVWDYGTDKNSNKGLCINDHWWKSILYFGNWGTMQPLCILPAWSIIVDSQYSLVVPPILFLIFKHKRLGYLTLLLAIVVSTTKMSFQLANQTAVRTSDMAKIRLHVYPLISRFAAEFYNTAWNRIGPVAIGIIGGHMLYLYDIQVIRRWPWFMRGALFKFILFLHVFIFMLPAIGRFTDNPESSNETDMTIFILSNATIKPIWSLINTIFLLRLITDLRRHSVLARLMSHNIWHCLGKLCFTSYLIHYEVIITLLKSRQEGLIDPNWSNALREFSTAFLISTLISYFIYILYEAPINKLITLCLAKPKNTIPNKNHKEEMIEISGQNGFNKSEFNRLDTNNCALDVEHPNGHLKSNVTSTKQLIEQSEQR